jgi:hypothetical protein
MRYLKRGTAADGRAKADHRVREIVEAALADIERRVISRTFTSIVRPAAQ